ncbi:uncharacterized protein LOC131819497 [Mustela lutreola]|uniref:uncharacterized protein LOC131819497 n=1 Tax=Mustela lutreola TaxID=9666 RepID=UPI002797743E|nr:uncharacterized protein LOC131819497 [Mustela lutreola]
MASGTSHTHQLTWLPAFLDVCSRNYACSAQEAADTNARDYQQAPLQILVDRQRIRSLDSGPHSWSRATSPHLSRDWRHSAPPQCNQHRSQVLAHAPSHLTNSSSMLILIFRPQNGLDASAIHACWRSLRFPLEIPPCFPSQEILLHFRPGSFIVAISQLERMKSQVPRQREAKPGFSPTRICVLPGKSQRHHHQVVTWEASSDNRGQG